VARVSRLPTAHCLPCTEQENHASQRIDRPDTLTRHPPFAQVHRGWTEAVPVTEMPVDTKFNTALPYRPPSPPWDVRGQEKRQLRDGIRQAQARAQHADRLRSHITPGAENPARCRKSLRRRSMRSPRSQRRTQRLTRRSAARGGLRCPRLGIETPHHSSSLSASSRRPSAIS